MVNVDARVAARPTLYTFGCADTERSVLEMARERIAHTFDLFDHVAVSFSGGKDSTVCLELALEEAERRGRLPLDVIFCDEEAIPYQTEEYVRRRALDQRLAVRWLCLPVKHRNACSRDADVWWPWAPEARDLWVRPRPIEGLVSLAGFPHDDPPRRYSWPDTTGLLFAPRRHGRVGLIMGIRADESRNRKHGVLLKQVDNYMTPYAGVTSRGNVTLVKPIYDWTTGDVWTAPRTLGWDYNEAYRLMDMAGLPVASQRCAPPYGEEPLAKLWTFAVCFPEIWERMCARVPGAATAARYANTRLYSFKDSVLKPDAHTWPQQISALLDKHEPSTRAVIAKRLAGMIARHYRKTSDPILERAPHPLSGLCWTFLARVASRGDLKERQQETNNLAKAPRAVLMERYKEALEREGGCTHGNGYSTAQQIG